MSRKNWIWIVLAAAAIVCSFLLPRFLLHLEQDGTEGQTETYSAEQTVVGTLTLTQKMNLIGYEMSENFDRYFQAKSSAGSYAAIHAQFMSELQKLLTLSAIEQTLYDSFAEGVSIERYLLIDEEGRSLVFFMIYSENNAIAYLDAESQMILQIEQIDVHASADNLLDTLLQNEEADTLADQPSYLSQQIAGWAEYYGMDAREISTVYPDNGLWDEELLYLASASFSDTDESLRFAILYRPGEDRMTWSAIPTDQRSDLTEVEP